MGKSKRWSGAPLAIASLLMLCGLAATGCQAQRPDAAAGGAGQTWRGARYPPLPQRVVIERGTTLGPADSASFALSEVSSGEDRMIWLASRVGGSHSSPEWAVEDVLQLPALSDERWLMLALCGRLEPGAPAEPESLRIDPEIVAIARADGDPVLTGIEAAWRANRTSKRIEPVSPAGLACLNDVEPEP